MTYFPTYMGKKALCDTISSTRKFLGLISLKEENNTIENEPSPTIDDSDDASLFEDECELFRRFSVSEGWCNNLYTQSEQKPHSTLGLEINFDHPSLEFEVSLQNVIPNDPESGGPHQEFELSWSWEKQGEFNINISRYRNIVDKIKEFIGIYPFMKNDPNEDNNTVNVSPVTTMKIPINEDEGVSRALDISIFSDDPVDDSHSTIKFRQYADILVYNKTGLESKSGSNFRSVRTLRSTMQKTSEQLPTSYSNSHCVHSILKNKVNHNFSEEFTNAKMTDSINLESFLSNFESFENEKFRNATGLNEQRLEQLRNYYSNKFV